LFGDLPEPGTPSKLPAYPMPETPIKRASRRKRKLNGNWNYDQLKSAIANVDEGMSIREAGRINGIPSSTLRGHVYGTTIYRKRGKKRVLTEAEEEGLVDYLIKMRNLGFPLTLGQLWEKVGILIQTRVTPFTDGVPSPRWVKCFKKRHPELSMRKVQALEQKRAQNLCPTSVGSSYDNLKKLYHIHEYEAHHVWNCDESDV